MNTSNNTPGMCEFLAKTIILSRGGAIYPKYLDLGFEVTDRRGDTKERSVSSIHFSPYQGGKYYLYFNGLEGFCELSEEEEKMKVFKYILGTYTYPDLGSLTPEEIADRLDIRSRNIGFISEHGDLTEGDFKLIAEYRKVVEASHKFADGNIVPMPGDIVEGAYYNGTYPFSHGVIESHSFDQEKLCVCAQPFTPWITDKPEDPGYHINSSGGPFFHFLSTDLELVGPDERTVCDWSHTGACGNGSISFTVKVNRWKIKPGEKY